MIDCPHVQACLAEEGVAAATREEIKRHIEGCAACSQVLDDLRRLEAALDELPTEDASDALVAKTLAAVRQDQAKPKAWPWQRSLATGLAASVVIAAAVGLTMRVYQPNQQLAMVAKDEVSRAENSESVMEQVAVIPESEEEPSLQLQSQRNEPLPAPAEERAAGFEVSQLAQKKAEESLYRSEANEQGARELDVIAQLEARTGAQAAGAKGKADRRLDDAPLQKSLGSGERQSLFGGTLRGLETQLENLAAEPVRPKETLTDEKSPRAKSRDEEADAALPTAPLVNSELGEASALLDHAEPKGSYAGPSLADDFLERNRDVDGLSFQEPVGYWANSYIPGDPVMRLLEARLAAWDRGALGQELGLEQDIAPIVQPFDGPQEAAMALYLTSDAAAIEGPTRLRLQVGLKGAERQGGHRPDMNIGLVIDQRELLDLESATRVRALIDALQRARQPGDRFSLTVAGPGGGLLVRPEDFRHGPLSVALERMLSGDVAGEALALPVAMELAAESLLAGDDPNGVLGSSLLLLVTGSDLAGDIETIETMTHRNAVGGLATSVVSLAARDDLSHVDRLVAAGQGHRRVLDTAQAAEGLVDRELHAASRAVARALRLRIRLAPGVKLIDVIGTERLGEPQAERVREAEQAIDQRLARTLGIDADRGEDEAGIQIVIPNFFAGDSHVILLDLLADRPGPIADVTLRYKDVVNLANGITQASLSLGEGARAPGHLELNVTKNLAAHAFAEQARSAGRALAVGDVPQAIQRLTALRDLLRGLREAVPAWRSDPELAADETLLNDYLALLASPIAGDAAQRRNLADSLQVAAFRKVQPPAR